MSNFSYPLTLTLPLIVFALDMLLNLNIGIYENGQVIKDRGKILRSYISEFTIFNDVITYIALASAD